MGKKQDEVQYTIVSANEVVPTEPSARQRRASKKERETDKIRFSIGAKLIMIISILVLVSLGSITALVSWLVREDLRVAAEEQNFELNRRNALDAEEAFENIKSHAIVLVQVIQSLGIDSDLAKDTADTFFEHNKNIYAIIISNEQLAINNEQLTMSNEEWNMVDEVILKNTALSVSSYPSIINITRQLGDHILGYFFKWSDNVIGVLFSPKKLADSFGVSFNKSYLVNGNNDILIHHDFEKVKYGENLSSDPFIKTMRSSMQRSMQTLYTDENGTRYFEAFTKLNVGGCALITSIEYDKVFEGIVETTKRNIYLTAAVLCVSVIIIWFFAKTISVPLKRLSIAAQRIEGGQFEIDIKPKRGKDEIRHLGVSFQKMSRALGIFGRFTNREIALLAMRGQIKPGGLPKHATIFFSDIRGFTDKSEKFTEKFGEEASDKIVHWLNDYLSRMVECVERTSGTIDKFIGDAVMAHWGTATTAGSPKRDAFNCVVSALMMRAALVKLNRRRGQWDEANPEISIGCGINTGIVTAGQIGSEQRMEYTVIGDPVNLASRIESLCKPLGTDILISESTWNFVKDYFITEEMPPVTVKGKAKPVRLFAVINLVSAKGGPKSLEEVRNLLGIQPPDLAAVDLNAEEKKYKIPETKKKG